jgi:hypothetical protein
LKPNNILNIIPASTVMSTTLNSVACQVYGSFAFSIQIFFTGTPTGSFKLQMSDYPAYTGVPNSGGSGLNVSPTTQWTDIANSTFTVTAAGNVAWDYSWAGFNWVRVVYSDTSGGSSTAIITSSTFNSKSM